MRSKIAKRILDETPEEVKIFVRLYADITVRINQLLRDKGISQKDLAEAMGKKPSEISKWLNGSHNFTLRSLAKLQAELKEDIIYIPKVRAIENSVHGSAKMTVYRNSSKSHASDFDKFTFKPSNHHANVS